MSGQIVQSISAKQRLFIVQRYFSCELIFPKVGKFPHVCDQIEPAFIYIAGPVVIGFDGYSTYDHRFSGQAYSFTNLVWPINSFLLMSVTCTR